MVSFLPSLFGQEAPHPPAFGEWIPFPATNPHAAGSSATIRVDNTGASVCEVRYVFLAAEAPKPTTASIDADPNKETLSIAPAAALSVTAARSDFSAGSYRLHAYFHHADSGTSTAVVTSDVLIFPRAPVFDFTSFFYAPGAGYTVDGLVGFGFENTGTATCTLEFFTVREGTVADLAATVTDIQDTGMATNILEERLRSRSVVIR